MASTIEEKLLANGMQLLLRDLSRPVAGDRWRIELQCTVAIPMAESFWAAVNGDDEKMRTEIRRQLGEHLTLTVTKLRNFVAEEEKEGVLAELRAQIEENVFSYLSAPAFPQKLFLRRYKETKDRILLYGRF